MKIKFPFLARFFASLVILLACTAYLAAQQAGRRVTGTVTDANGAAVTSVRVDLLNSQQATIATQTTDTQGHFTFENIAPGAYQVVAARTDFGSRRVAANVRANQDSTVELELDPLEVTESVTITAETGRAESVDKVVQQVNVIGEEALQQRATGVLAQVADEEPGLSLQRTSPTISAIFVRGLTGKNVATYVDGVRYTHAAGRGGINTFFNLTDPSELRAVEVLRGPNSAQYGSDSLGGTVNLITRTPVFGGPTPETHAEFNTFYTSADNSFGSSATMSYGTRHFGLLVNGNGRRVNTLRSADGLDGHAAVTRFFGIRSDIFGTRLPDTAFTQYGGALRMHYAPTADDQFIVHYQRNQQDGGKRYDQTLGGDGNLIADLRNLMGDFFYARYVRNRLGFFDSGSFTFSYNNQREERVNQGGRGLATGDITHQYERTRVYGGSFFLNKQLYANNSLLFGGDYYSERFTSPAYTYRPPTNAFFFSRPRVPNGARYRQGGLYVQDSWDFVPNRARLSAALRYNVAQYRVRSSDSPVVNGAPLFPSDSLRVDDFSGRIGVVVFPEIEGLSLAFNYSRGFRAPNMTDLGTLGLTGDGFEVDFFSSNALGGFVGTTAGGTAVSTGVPVTQQKSELSNNIDATVRYHRSRFDGDFTFFNIDINDAIVKRALILPAGAVGRTIGGNVITSQAAGGAVFVAASTVPVLVRTNFTKARLYGFEISNEIKLSRAWTFGGNFTYIHAEDRATGLAPDIEGGTPAPTGFVRLRYQPTRRYWVEAYSTMARRQSRLSSLDLGDRRTGAIRSRADIANFFNRGARARGLTNPGPDGVFGTADDRLTVTNETLAQIQNRVLGTAASAPLFDHLPGYGLFNVRGGVRFGERHTLSFDFENITDQAYRGPSWGIDGPGRSVSARYQYRF